MSDPLTQTMKAFNKPTEPSSFTKPATQKQKDLITKLCARNKVPVPKFLNDMSISEANIYTKGLLFYHFRT
jgi:hypothetical protein